MTKTEAGLVSDRSFAAMQHRVIQHTAQIRRAGERHKDCCGSLAEVVEHDKADAEKLNVSHVARAVVELLGGNEPFAKDGQREIDAAAERVKKLTPADITDETIDAVTAAKVAQR